jgi:SAM-dependent methyltransferase
MLPSALRPEPEARRWYEEKVREYGFDHRGLGFRSRGSQERRFNALLALGNFDGRRLLDVGCGFGDFLGFLLERQVRPIYTGLDICAPMISRCHQRFAVSEGIFAVGDALDYEPRVPFDFVVASGIFGLDAGDTRERIRPTLERMFGWCREGIAVNFLSTRSPERAANRFYVDPRDALEWGFALTPSVRIDHSYLPNDFTLILDKTPSWAQTRAGGTQ